MIACILQITVKFFIEKYPLAESAQSAADSHGRIVKLCQFTLGISPYWCLKFSHLICIIGSKVISCLIQIYIIQQFFPKNQVYIFTTFNLVKASYIFVFLTLKYAFIGVLIIILQKSTDFTINVTKKYPK